MTAETRFERELPAILEDLYLGPDPDYRIEVLAAATRRRQRPAWAFPGRWLPMADIASRPVIAPHVPWRTVGMALLVIALLLAVALAVVGSRQTKVPPPFGPATNGLIVYAVDGDIHVLDPATGISTPLVTGPEQDAEPAFSPDGTRIAFRREMTVDGSTPPVLVVAEASGANPTVVTAAEPDAGAGRFEWSFDSRSLLISDDEDFEIWLFDALAPGAPRVIATDATAYPRPFQPPLGEAILVQHPVSSGVELVLMNLATGDRTPLAEGGPSNDLGSARWSGDGSQVVYNAEPDDDWGSQRLFIVNADGTGTRQITDAPGTWFDIDATWSADGKWIAFTRYERVDGTTWDVRPTGIYSVAGDTVTGVGPLPREVRAQYPSPGDDTASYGEGFALEWSPDQSRLIAFPNEGSGRAVLIDPATGAWEAFDAILEPNLPIQAWQRKAP